MKHELNSLTTKLENSESKKIDAVFVHEHVIFERKLIPAALTFSELSDAKNTTNLGIEATKLYTRLVLSSITINTLIPYNNINATTLWNFPSIATLTRAFIETSHRHLYLSEPKLSSDDSEFRLKLFYFHLNSEKAKLFDGLGADKQAVDEITQHLPNLKHWIINSPIFANLPKYKQDKIKKHSMDMYLSDEEIAQKNKLLDGKFAGMYRLLSNHCHGSPFATQSQSNERGRGLENDIEKNYIALCLKMLNQYLSKTILAQAKLLSLEKIDPAAYKSAKMIFENTKK